MRRPAAVPTSRLPALRETAAALLRVLSAGDASPHDIARIVVLDPVLVFELLLTSPIDSGDQSSLLDLVADRLVRIDTGLLQAWSLRHLIQQPQRNISTRAHRHHALHSLFVAELAANLAHEMDYPQPNDAYVAGLMHDLGLLWLTEYRSDYPKVLADSIDERGLSAAEWERYGFDHAELSSDLATRCGFAPGIADAIALHQAEPDAVVSAHPLVRIIAAAEELASYRGSQSAASLEGASRLTKIDGSLLVSLLADTTRGMQNTVKGLDLVVEPTMLTLPWSASGGEVEREIVDTGIARTALTAFSRSAFIDSSSARQSFDVATRLLLGLDAPVLFVKMLGEDALAGAPDPAHPGLDQIQISTQDEQSALAEAYRDDAETRYLNDQRPPGRCAADWQLARWLDSDGLIVVPWRNPNESGVAVFPCPNGEDPGRDIETGLRKSVTAAATARISERRTDEQTRRDLEESIARRYVEHARRIAHEASNPLTVIKTYLGMIDERVKDATLKEQLTLLSDELDRVGALVRKASDFTSITPSGPAHSGVAEILHDLRALYGEALFGRKGINFELRTSPNLPAAAIPPDALKQVFLNLFKNAAEAIPEGGKLTVSAVAGINANGSPCMEIRIVDNGPGLAPERIETLFTAGAKNSDKPGGGVDLPLVRELVASVGGTILCRSQPGSGTVFQIFMPLAATP
ncbi:MAG TPA: HDOD domain-containing protein [Zoogloea sp.]|nr:HDOD domain-containing protein [Zoogloea sp.]